MRHANCLRSALSVLLCLAPLSAHGTILSPSDKVQVTVNNAEEFSGEQTVRSDGTIRFPMLGAIPAAGLEEGDVEQALTEALKRYIKNPQVTLRLSTAGPITVSVNGAVYSPGPVVLSAQTPSLSERTNPVALPDIALARTLSSAIRSAGGLKPQASKRVVLKRGGVIREIDVSGAFDGRGFENVALVGGDTIEVSETDQIDEQLLRPSQLTPQNISVNVAGKLPKAGQLTLPIGSTLVDGLAAAGAGGGGLSEANREAVLVRKDIASGKLIARSFPVDQLTNGPPLMQGDTIVVKEGSTSGILEFLRGVFSPLVPILYFLR